MAKYHRLAYEAGYKHAAPGAGPPHHNAVLSVPPPLLVPSVELSTVFLTGLCSICCLLLLFLLSEY